MPPPVAMTAAPRERAVHQRCVASVLRAGFSDLTICAEPGTCVCDWRAQGLPVVIHGRRLGQWSNFIFSLRHLLQIRPDAPLLCTVEDDVVFCRGVAELLRLHRWPSERCGCLQLYTSAHYDRYPQSQRSRLEPADALDLLGACALVFSRPAAQCLVDWADDYGWRGHVYESVAAAQTDPADKEGADTYVGEVLTYRGYEIWMHNPSLAQHIGDVSTLGHVDGTPRRTGLNWPGEDADAIQLLTQEAPCGS